MGIVDRIKAVTPKQWALVVGLGGAAALGVDYYRRRDESLVGRAWRKIHGAHEAPPPALPAGRQPQRGVPHGAPRRPQAMPLPGMGADMGGGVPYGAPQLAMVPEVVYEGFPAYDWPYRYHWERPSGWGLRDHEHEWRGHAGPEGHREVPHGGHGGGQPPAHGGHR